MFTPRHSQSFGNAVPARRRAQRPTDWTRQLPTDWNRADGLRRLPTDWAPLAIPTDWSPRVVPTDWSPATPLPQLPTDWTR